MHFQVEPAISKRIGKSVSQTNDEPLPFMARERDAEYMAAVESGDTATQQRLVDEAAKAAGYDRRVFHGNVEAKADLDVLGPSFEAGEGIFTTDNPDVADIFRYEREYGEVITEHFDEEADEYVEVEPGARLALFANPGRQLNLSDTEVDPQEFVLDTGLQSRTLKKAKADGFDSVLVPDVREGVGDWMEEGSTTVVFNPRSLKSADPVTRDDQGNVIPLSKRFDAEQDDIRYMAREKTAEVGKEIAAKHGIEVNLNDRANGDVELSHIAIKPKSRQKQGIGTQAMQDIIAFADRAGKRITLTTGVKDPDFGTTSATRLKKFYKRFGFVENKGRNKDFSISGNMYREPDLKFMARERDDQYAEAVEDGDTDAQQRIVEEQAKSDGYNIGLVWHGTRKDNDDFTVFRTGTGNFTHDKKMATSWGKSRPFYLNMQNPLKVEDDSLWIREEFLDQLVYLEVLDNATADALLKRIRNSTETHGVRFSWIMDEVAKKGYDGFVYDNIYEGGGISYKPFNPSQIKSADPITRDDQGNVIPPSQRFDLNQEDIRFMAREDSQMDDEINAAEDRKNNRAPSGRALSFLKTVRDSDYSAPQLRAKLAARLENNPEARQDGQSMQELMDFSRDWIEGEGGFFKAYNAIGGEKFRALTVSQKVAVIGTVIQYLNAVGYETNDDSFFDQAEKLIQIKAEVGLEYGRGIKAFDMWRDMAPSNIAEARQFARRLYNQSMKEAFKRKSRSDVMNSASDQASKDTQEALQNAINKAKQEKQRRFDAEKAYQDVMKIWEDRRRDLFNKKPAVSEDLSDAIDDAADTALDYLNSLENDLRFMAREDGTPSTEIYEALVKIAERGLKTSLVSGEDMSSATAGVMRQLESVAPKFSAAFSQIIDRAGMELSVKVELSDEVASTPQRPRTAPEGQEQGGKAKPRKKRKRDRSKQKAAQAQAPAMWLNNIVNETQATLDEILNEIAWLKAGATAKERAEAQAQALERLEELAEAEGISLDEAQALLWQQAKDTERDGMVEWAETKLEPKAVIDRVIENSLLAWGRANGMPEADLTKALGSGRPLGELQKWAEANNVPAPSEIPLAPGYENLEAGLTASTLAAPEPRAKTAQTEAQKRLSRIAQQGRVAYELQQLDYEENGVQRALKTILDDIIRQPMLSGTKIVEQIEERIIDRGWPKADAKRIAKQIADTYADMIKRTMRANLERRFIKDNVRRGMEDSKAIIDIVSASRTNMLSDLEFTQAFAKAYGLKTLGPKEQEKIEELGQAIEDMANMTGNPSSKQVMDAQLALNNYMASLMPTNILNMIMTFRKQAMLSGFSTAVTNTVSNATNTEIAIETLIWKELARGNLGNVSIILKGAAMSFEGEGWNEFWRILINKETPWKSNQKLDTGYDPDPTQSHPIFNKGGYWNPLKYATHVFAWMYAQDYPFFLTSEGAGAALQTAKELQTDPTMKGIRLQREVARKMGWGKDFQPHLDQAKSEGFTGKKMKQRAYELRRDSWSAEAQHKGKELGNIGTYNVERPSGLLGKFSNWVNTVKREGGDGAIIADILMPFTSIPTNVANAVIANSPLGFYRALLKQGQTTDAATGKLRDVTADEKLGWTIQATRGTLLMVSGALFFLSKWREWKDDEDEDKGEFPPFNITAHGPAGTNERAKWYAAGYEPYTITIGGKTLSYRAWGPSIGLMAPMGAMMDMLNFGESDDPTRNEDFKQRLALNSMLALPQAVIAQTTLMQVSDILDVLNKANVRDSKEALSKLRTISARTTTSVVPNFFKQLDNIWDPSMYPSDTLAEAFIQNIPFAASDRLNKRLNLFGEPIELSRMRQFYQVPWPRDAFKPDPVAKWLIKNDVSLSPPHYKPVDTDPRTGKLTPRLMTTEEKYQFLLIWGPMMKAELADRIESGYYVDMHPKRMESSLRKLKTRMRKSAAFEFEKQRGDI